MSKVLVKFSPEWFAAKKQARKDLDYKLSIGVSHADTSVAAPEASEGGSETAEAPKAKKSTSKAPKAK